MRLRLLRTIGGRIAPKSVGATGTGLVFAQNMMYEHSVTVYGANGKLLATIRDGVTPSQFGFERYDARVFGSPVEVAFTPDRRKAYVSNYSMYGSGFPSPGHDSCSPADHHDRSFVYRIDVAKDKIDQLIRVGSVPKVVAVTPDGKYLLVSDWCSYALSVVDIAKAREIARIPLGPYPRGIVVDEQSRYAYVAIMGSTRIARLDLRTLKVRWIDGVGVGPRALVLSPNGRFLYATLNSQAAVAKLSLKSGRVVGRATVGTEPRSMTINPDGRVLYLVNYGSDTAMVVRTDDMKVLQSVQTGTDPIGITYEPTEGRVWISNYTGSIRLFEQVRARG